MDTTHVKGKSPLPESPETYVCEECGDETAVYLSAPNPFNRGETIVGCPSCWSVDSLVRACWKCKAPATSGTPNAGGFRYVHSCFKHRPKENES